MMFEKDIRRILLMSTFFIALMAIMFGSYQQAMTAAFMIVITGITYIIKLFCPFVLPSTSIEAYTKQLDTLLSRELSGKASDNGVEQS